MSELTMVISVRGRNRDELLANPKFQYVGRPVYRGSLNWKGSIWSNPFKVGMKRHAAIRILGEDIDNEPRAETIDARLCLIFYKEWLREKSGLMSRIPELRSKVLGCWCIDWYPGQSQETFCHAIFLAQLANKLELSRC